MKNILFRNLFVFLYCVFFFSLSSVQGKQDIPLAIDPRFPISAISLSELDNGKFFDQKKSIVFSPTSISDVMHLVSRGIGPKGLDEFHQVFGKGLEKRIPHRLSSTKVQVYDAYNIWFNSSFELKNEFLDSVKSGFNLVPKSLDFAQKPTESAAEMNSWIEKSTERRIKNIFQAADLKEMTRVVLANTIYFKGRWSQPFQSHRSSEGQFRNQDGSETTVNYMNNTALFDYQEDKTMRLLSLPYLDSDYQMKFVIPKDASWVFDQQTFDFVFSKTVPAQLWIKIPKLELQLKTNLREFLESLGLKKIFDLKTADFTKISKEKIFISKVIHATYLKVDENGTEAAALTAASADGMGAPPRVGKFHLNRPFRLFLVHVPTKQILFYGNIKSL